MKTIICDIDGTLTDMWPIERAVLLRLLGIGSAAKLNVLKKSEISETYLLYLAVSQRKIGRRMYRKLYNEAFDYLCSCGQLPKPKSYPLVQWIIKNSRKYRFVYATGGQQQESEYVLKQLGILDLFDTKHSLDKTRYPFSKKTGLPFKKIKRRFRDCVCITDRLSDCEGTQLARISFIQIKPSQAILHLKIE